MLGRIPQMSADDAVATREVVAALTARGRPHQRNALARALREAVAAGRVDADTARAAVADGDIDRVARLVADVTEAIHRQFRPLPPIEDDAGREHARPHAIAASPGGRVSIQRWLCEAHRLGLVSRTSIERALARGSSRVLALADASARRFWREVFADMPEFARRGMPWFHTLEFAFDDEGWHLMGTAPLTAIPVTSVMALPQGLAQAVRTAFDALSCFGLPFHSFIDWECSLDEDMMVVESLDWVYAYREDKGAPLTADDYQAIADETGLVSPVMLEVLHTLVQSGWGFPAPLAEYDALLRGEDTVAGLAAQLRAYSRAYPGWRWAQWVDAVAEAIEWFAQQDHEALDARGDGPPDLVGCGLQPGVCPELEDHNLEMLNEHLMQAPGWGLLAQPSMATLRTYFLGLAWVLGLLREAAHIDTAQEEVHRHDRYFERDAA